MEMKALFQYGMLIGYPVYIIFSSEYPSSPLWDYIENIAAIMFFLVWLVMHWKSCVVVMIWMAPFAWGMTTDHEGFALLWLCSWPIHLAIIGNIYGRYSKAPDIDEG